MNFFQSGVDVEDVYAALRDREDLRAERGYIEQLWDWYGPLADSHFTSDARKHFYERFWEMYCAKGFSNASLRLSAMNGKGPDFCAELPGLRVYVEANVPGPGTGADGVPDITPGVAQESPEKEIVLRLRNGLEEKLKQWKKWKKSETVSKHDAYIVAFNSRRMHIAAPNWAMPYIVKTVFPLGDLTTVWGTNTTEGDSFYAERSSLKKASGNEVGTDVFLSDEYAEVSAVLYSRADCFNKPESEGQDFTVVHNPLATVKLPRDFLGFGKEYWVSDQGKLCDRDWNNG